MTDDRSLHQARVFERFWDALVSGRTVASPDELEPDVVEVARRLRALDRPATVDTAFETRLWEELMHTHALDATIPLHLTPFPYPNDPNGRLSGGGASTAPAAIPTARSRAQHRVGAGLTWLATAALVAAVLAMAFFVYRNDQRAVIVVQETPPPVATPAVPEPTGWLQFRGSADRSGQAVGPGPEGEPVLRWMAHPTGETGLDAIYEPFAIADGVMYVSTGHGLLALSTVDGSELWRQEGYGGDPVVVGDGLIVRSLVEGSDRGDLVRLRRSDGGEVWRAEIGRILAPWYPAVVDDVIYTPSLPNDLVAIEATSGSVLWRTALAAPASRSAAIADGAVYVGLESGELVALETAGGDLLWTAPTPGTILGVPSISGGAIYMATRDGPSNSFYALDQATGEARWTFVTPSRSGFYYPAIDQSTVFVSSVDGSLYALDSATGALRWRFDTAAELAAMPVIIDGTLYFAGNDGFAYALDALDGAELWRFAIDGPSLWSPAVLDGVVYLTTATGSIYAIGGSGSSADAASTPLAGASPVADASPIGANAVTEGNPGRPTGAEFVWASGGSDVRRLSLPKCVRVSPDGMLWVSSMPDELLILDSDGALQDVWVSPGSRLGERSSIYDQPRLGAFAFAADGSFWVVNGLDSQLQHFDSDRKLLSQFGSSGTGPGQFLFPFFLAIAPDGTIWVADYDRNDVQHFAADGTYLGVQTGAGTPEGPLVRPGGVAVDAAGNLYVTEVDRGRVRIFAPDGSSRGYLGADGPDFGGFQQPFDLAFDRNGYLYVADQDNNRVVVFDPEGRFAFTWGEFGTGDGQFRNALSVAVAADGTVYVIDEDNNRVQKFKLTGPFPEPAEATPTP